MRVYVRAVPSISTSKGIAKCNFVPRFIRHPSLESGPLISGKTRTTVVIGWLLCLVLLLRLMKLFFGLDLCLNYTEWDSVLSFAG